MRQRDLRCRRRAERGGDAGNDLHRHAHRVAGLNFLPAAAEHERIAALEAHDVAPGERLAHQERVDFFLGQGVPGTAFGDRDELRLRPRESEDRRLDQPVMHDQVGMGDQPSSAQCQQVRIARARADEVNGANFIHARQMRAAPQHHQRECLSGWLGQL